MDLKCDVLATD